MSLKDLPLFAADPNDKSPNSWVNEQLAAMPVARAPRPDPASQDTPPRRPAPYAAGAEGRRRTEVDWNLVQRYRERVSTELAETVAADSDPGSSVGWRDSERTRERGRAIIWQLLERDAKDALANNQPPLSQEQERALGVAVFDSLFRLGRLQPLVDDPEIETIDILGYDEVRAEYANGQVKKLDIQVAESDEDLIESFAFLASRTEDAERAFTPAQPTLHMRLPGGARLAAAAWVTPRPSASIRLHRLVAVTLEDLAGRRTLSPLNAHFHDVAMKAKMSTIVSGAQGAGKTTFTRATCAAIPADQKIGTFESEYELQLTELGLNAWVAPFEARPGAGEPGPDGKRAGEITMTDLLKDSWRWKIDRYVIGEIRGQEVLALLDAITTSHGALATTHSHSAVATIDRLVEAALKAGPHVTAEYARRALARNVDLITHINRRVIHHSDGTTSFHRYVSDVLAVRWSPDAESKIEASYIFSGGSPTEPARANTIPEYLHERLADAGFDFDWFNTEAASRPQREEEAL